MENTVELDTYRYINTLTIKELRSFVVAAIQKYSTTEKLVEANSVIDILMDMLKHKNQLNENGNQSFVEILVAAALLHNVFYDPKEFSTLFKARELLTDLAIEYNMPMNAYYPIFQTIEAQLGDKTPVPACLPVSNGPTELFSWALWIYHTYIKAI